MSSAATVFLRSDDGTIDSGPTYARRRFRQIRSNRHTGRPKTLQRHKLKDVRDAAIQIERQLRARRTQRNMARLDPFLRGVEHYSKVVEVLCNGTPYLSWVWAPVKLMLMVRYLGRQLLFVCDTSALLKPRVRSRLIPSALSKH